MAFISICRNFGHKKIRKFASSQSPGYVRTGKEDEVTV